MLRNWKNLLAGAALLVVAPLASAFTLLGPGGAEGITIKDWQLPAQNQNWDIGYNLPGDIGSPVSFGEFYRWNTPIITYAFDSSFVTYFGKPGMAAVDAAMRILNGVPHTTKMSEDLSEFPLNSAQLNYEAAQLGLVDLKSSVLSLMLGQMGLGDPIRWSYGIRQRINLPDDFGDYSVTRFNYDPVTAAPSSYVNGTLWTYSIFEIPPPVMFADAVEELPGPLNNEVVNYPVAVNSFVSRPYVNEYRPLLSGYYFTSLTRDDMGGIRYLLRPRNTVIEPLLPDIQPGGGHVWSPFLTNNILTNGVLGTNGSTGLRKGLGKIRFRKVIAYQTPFKPVRYVYDDAFVDSLGFDRKQSVVRTITTPDITFAAADIYPAPFAQTSTAGWTDNDTLNGVSTVGGPGIITPPIVFTFNNTPRIVRNATPFFVAEPLLTDTNSRANGLIGSVWASFDGTTNAPVIYPINPFGQNDITYDQLRKFAEGNPLR